MIDIHCHLLPGLDDGAHSVEEALHIATQLYEAGFKLVMVTPHVLEGRDYLTPERILEATKNLNAILREQNIPLFISPGAENYIFPNMAKWLAEGKLLTLGNSGKYLLVELPSLDIPFYTDQVFFELKVAGVTPVLAHPERNKKIVEEPEQLISWAERGILFQVDLRSLGGRYGPEAKQFGNAMVQCGLVHFIGSDAHRVALPEKVYENELKYLRDMVKEEYFKLMTLDHPLRVMMGRSIEGQLDFDFDLFLKTMRSKQQGRKAAFWFQRFLNLL